MKPQNWRLVGKGQKFEGSHGRNIAQKMKFSIKDFFNKCDQIRRTHQNP